MKIETQTIETPVITTTETGGVKTTTTPVMVDSEPHSSTVWLFVLTTLITTLTVGGMAMVYHQNAMTQLENDYELQIEKMRNQMSNMQIREQITDDVKEELKDEQTTSPKP